MKAKEVGRVEYVIDMDSKPDKIKFMWKKGTMYLTIGDVILNSEHKWYELPADTIEDILIDDAGVLTIHFKAGSLKVVSKDVNSLKVLRHFLLPYVYGERIA